MGIRDVFRARVLGARPFVAPTRPPRVEGARRPAVTLLTGSLPPEVFGVGDYTARLYQELGKLVSVDLTHIPLRRPFEPTLFSVFRGRRIVHAQYPTEGWGNSLLPTFLPLAKGRAKLLITLHEWSQMNRFRRASILPLVAQADGFIFVSEHERDAFLATAPPRARRQPTWVVPIGVNLDVPKLTSEEVLAFRARLLEGGYDLLLTHFGFIHGGKQPEKMLDAVASLVAMGRMPKLVFVGDFQQDKADEREAFRKSIAKRGLEPYVVLRGFVTDDREAALYLAASDANVSLFADGLSPRRGSFWYSTQHGCSLVTTIPGDWRDFGALQSFLQPPHVRFVEPDGSGDQIARLIQEQEPFAPFRYPKIPVPTWSEIAERHARVYAELLA